MINKFERETSQVLGEGKEFGLAMMTNEKTENYKENDGLTTAQLTNQPSYSYWLTQQKRRYDFFFTVSFGGNSACSSLF